MKTSAFTFLFFLNFCYVIAFNQTANDSLVQHEPPGSTCENPYQIELPLVDFQGGTEPMGDYYSKEMISPMSYYINGNEMVFKFNIEETSLLYGNMTASDSYIGAFIMQDCPDPDNPPLMNAWSSSYTNTLNLPSDNPNQPQEILLLPGEYLLIVSSYPPPQTITFTLNLWTESLPQNCSAPISPFTGAITENSAVLNWSETGEADQWDIIYGNAGFDIQNEGILIENISNNPFTLENLVPMTKYEFYVRAVCSDTSFSEWSDSYTFSTECDYAMTGYFEESFEGASAPPPCWAMWYANMTPEEGNFMKHTGEESYAGAQSFRFSSHEPGPPYNQFLRTPKMNIPNDMLFSFRYKKSDTPYVPPFTVGTSEDGQEWNWSDTITDAADLEWNKFEQYIESSVQYIAIQYLGIYGVSHYLYIDDFSVFPFYSLSLEAVPEQGGTVEGSGYYLTGDSIPISAMPNSNYVFVNWTDQEGNIITESASFHYEIPDMDKTLYANFELMESLDECSYENLKIYPNPASSELFIEYHSKIDEVRIWDFLGKPVFQERINHSKKVIRVSELKAGVHTIQIVSGNHVYYHKVLVSK